MTSAGAGEKLGRAWFTEREYRQMGSDACGEYGWVTGFRGSKGTF